MQGHFPPCELFADELEFPISDAPFAAREEGDDQRAAEGEIGGCEAGQDGPGVGEEAAGFGDFLLLEFLEGLGSELFAVFSRYFREERPKKAPYPSTMMEILIVNGLSVGGW